MNEKIKILVVDDEPFNLDIMTEYLQDEGFEVICAEDGDIALKEAEEHLDLNLIILDRMMPRMNGIEVLKHLKNNNKLSHIPVIMQTAAASSEQIQEGLRAGVYYYLAKPYNQTLLLSIVYSAIRDDAVRLSKGKELPQNHFLGLMESARFHFRTIDDINVLTYLIAGCFPKPEHAVYGLHELMLNAVEHGNLGITYDEKMDLVMQNKWKEEILRRLELPENSRKHATLTYESSAEEVVITIRDQGKGFNWKEYVDFSPLRSLDPNGRGIALTRIRSFANLQYIGNGNEVTFRVKR